jgi:BolA protein
MRPDERINLMQARLQQKFSPRTLEIIDDSGRHVGHAGSQNGAGHYTVKISADSFINKSRVDTHREIYALFADLIPDEIHALQIKILE